MKSLLLAAAELEAFLIEQGWRYCFIGGIALPACTGCTAM